MSCTDRPHCGSCTNSCGPGCPLGILPCSLVCADTRTDPENCGACGNACPSSMGYCALGRCVSTCPTGTTPCGRSGVVLRDDPGNCGACGHLCGPLQACILSICVP